MKLCYNDMAVKCDLLEYSSDKVFDVVVLSLVLNFEGDPRRRGDMLYKTRELVSQDGWVFIALPKVSCETQ